MRRSAKNADAAAGKCFDGVGTASQVHSEAGWPPGGWPPEGAFRCRLQWPRPSSCLSQRIPMPTARLQSNAQVRSAGIDASVGFLIGSGSPVVLLTMLVRRPIRVAVLQLPAAVPARRVEMGR